MTVRLLILIIGITLILAIGLLKKYRPDLIDKLNLNMFGTSNSTVGYWTGLGIAFGAAIGSGIDDVGTGVAFGICFGAAIGAALSKRKRVSS